VYKLPYLISVVAIWCAVLQGDKRPNAWLVTLGCQVLWIVWIVAAAQWGMLPLNGFMWAVSIRNHLRWRRN
jgi:hypothetical protein